MGMPNSHRLSPRRRSSQKVARLEARLTPATQALLQRAATLEGRSVSDFVMTAARAAAEATIAQHELLELSQADQEHFALALLNPPRLAPALERAAAAHRKLVRRP